MGVIGLVTLGTPHPTLVPHSLARRYSAGIELLHEAFVAELFHKPVVDKFGEKSLHGPTGNA
jgi:hypothetical protein